VLRCFEDGDITHVEGRIDPVADAETIETELMLADLEPRSNARLPTWRKQAEGRRQGSAGSGPPAAGRAGGAERGQARRAR
jgi:ribosome-binding ATPase YchF (GTP1/OBG family)